MTTKEKNQIVKALEAKRENLMERINDDCSVTILEWELRKKYEKGSKAPSWSIEIWNQSAKNVPGSGGVGFKVEDSGLLHDVEALITMIKWYGVSGYYVSTKYMSIEAHDSYSRPIPSLTIF